MRRFPLKRQQMNFKKNSSKVRVRGFNSSICLNVRYEYKKKLLYHRMGFILCVL